MASCPLRVQTLFLFPFRGRRGTDYLYYWKLKELERRYPVVFHPYTALLPVAMGNALHAADRVWWRLAHRSGVAIPTWWSTLRRVTVAPRSAGRFGTDLIYTNYLIPANRVGVPIVLEWDFNVYGTSDERKHLRQDLYVPAWFIRRVAVVIVRHELSRGAFAAKYPDDAHKAVIVPLYMPWVEPVGEDLVVRKFGQAAGGEVEILFVGNDARRKGLPALLDAYGRLRRAGRGVRLTIVSNFHDGGVALPPDVVVRSNLKPAEIYELMERAHIFAMPTRLDAHPAVYREAMANGCALLFPDTSPHRDLLGDYGLAVPPDDLEAITTGLQGLLDHMDFTRSCALRGRQAFAEQLHHRVVGRQYWDVLQRALDGSRVP